MQTCTIGMSMDADIKMRSRRRWKKGHVYIHNAKSVSEPLTRLPCPCPCNAVISVFRNGAVTLKAYCRDIKLTIDNSLKGQFTSNINSLYIILPLILKAATPVGAA